MPPQQETGTDVSSKMLRKKTSFALPVEVMHRFKIACAMRGVDQTAVVLEGIEGFLNAKALHAVSAKEVNPENQTWHDQLEAVLESNIHTAADMIQHAITAAYELVECNKRLVANGKRKPR